ncbi:hypothetical protein [Kineococcus auxinigenes]|uniref:hypothetical protein n=1 Tax=unclassified Kineococcus TaxID=2621656 RepID=UPI003D7EB77C
MAWWRKSPENGPSAPPPAAGAESRLGDWEGAGRWPQDDEAAPSPGEGEVLPWINVDPGRPSAGV